MEEPTITAVSRLPAPAAEVIAPHRDFLGRLLEVGIVSADWRRTALGLARCGIGPWRVYTFQPDNVTAQTYRGTPCPFSLKVCFAQGAGGLVWEIIQPLAGPTIFQEHLDRHGEGIHHLAFDCGGLPWEERLAGFARRGFPLAQSGNWLDQNPFAFFETEAATTVVETYRFADGFVYPEPETWIGIEAGPDEPARVDPALAGPAPETFLR